MVSKLYHVSGIADLSCYTETLLSMNASCLDVIMLAQVLVKRLRQIQVRWRQNLTIQK